jgi:hypothetical protein
VPTSAPSITASAGAVDQALTDECGDDQRGRGAALDQRGDAEPGGKRGEAAGHALPQHAPQVAAIEAQDAGADDMRPPDEQGDASQQIEQYLHQPRRIAASMMPAKCSSGGVVTPAVLAASSHRRKAIARSAPGCAANAAAASWS